MPGRDVIALGTHDEHRQLHVAQRERTATGQQASLGELVVEEQMAQIFDMHARWQARAVGIPGHQVVRHVLLAE
jgi:hypothetical protein